MQFCEQCIVLRDKLIDALAAYATFLKAAIDHRKSGQPGLADDAEQSASRAGEEVTRAKGALEDHQEGHR
jgi:hypothetical protein